LTTARSLQLSLRISSTLPLAFNSFLCALTRLVDSGVDDGVGAGVSRFECFFGVRPDVLLRSGVSPPRLMELPRDSISRMVGVARPVTFPPSVPRLTGVRRAAVRLPPALGLSGGTAGSWLFVLVGVRATSRELSDV
jgi:hypothetical protein